MDKTVFEFGRPVREIIGRPLEILWLACSHVHPPCRADGGERDALEARLGRGFQTGEDDGTERLLQVVDHEDDVLEAAEVLPRLAGHDRLTVGERHGDLRLRVEHVSRRALDDAVDPAEPDTARVDGGHENFGGKGADVAGGHFGLHFVASLSIVRVLMPQGKPCVHHK